MTINRILLTAVAFTCILLFVGADQQHNAQDEPLNGFSYENMDPFHRYGRVTSLFEHIHPAHFPTETDKANEINKIKEEMVALGHRLYKEEHTLRALRRSRDKEKTTVFWFFDPDTRHRVERAQLLVNDQVRVIENLAEDIEFHWKQLKPLYGLYSKLFLAELVGFIPDLFAAALRLMSSSLSLGLLSFVIFGPVAFFLLAFWLSFGMVLLPFVLFGVMVFWLFHLPVIMIEYNPSVLQFVSVYLPILAAFLFALRQFVRSRFLVKL